MSVLILERGIIRAEFTRTQRLSLLSAPPSERANADFLTLGDMKMKIATKWFVTESMISIATDEIRTRIYEGIELLAERRDSRENIDNWLGLVVYNLSRVALNHSDIAAFTGDRFEEEFQSEFQLPPSVTDERRALKKLLALKIRALASLIDLSDAEKEDLERATH
jgi:hypothetical protein